MDLKSKNNLPIISIFGRTNVGKSTLFNCIIEKNQAITSKLEGTTRDSNIHNAEWRNEKFILIDTGGIINIKHLINKKIKNKNINTKIQSKVKNYLKKSDLILFLVDNKTGLLPQDKDLAMYLKKRYENNKIILVANKTDNFKIRANAAEFNKLPLSEPVLVSAANGSGTGDLLDIIINKLKKNKKFNHNPNSNDNNNDEEKKIKVCIIGKPNVGKSSLLNSLLGYERVIVSSTPHTTREPQDTKITYKKNNITIIDTAGISKKGKTSKGLERQGILKSLKALNKSNIALLIIDINKKITRQDQRLVDEIINRNKSFIFIANKWDLIKERNTKEFKKHIYRKFPFATWVPIQFISAKTGEKINKILDIILELSLNRKIDLTNAILSRFLNKIIKNHRPTKSKGTKRPRIYELKQLKANPPIFEIRIGPKDTIANSYVRFIENRLREKFKFNGTPLKIAISKKIHTPSEHQQ